MITYLLDVNLLLALFDPAHEHYRPAHAWYQGTRSWASCPITENGFIRIGSNAAYPGTPGGPTVLAKMLKTFAGQSRHTFWPAELSLRDGDVFDLDKIQSSTQITDIYLLGLATKRGGRLATLDQQIDPGPVKGGPEALEVIPVS